ncbi:MAG: penicillin acylase family protein [Flammeovirgaceae bacterium]|nr:MAG: penicillin acylase family protein [Flammeovirgaceae bacterium]
MKIKFLISLAITLLLVWALDKRWTAGTIPIPPLGKFLAPSHGFWQNIESRGYQLPESLNLPGLKQPVTIVFDSIMIPHIIAQSDEDLYYAQGYITAFHRLWQMEFQTHAAAGRLSEIVGKSKDDAALNYDRQQRRLGMVYAAENALRKMESDPLAKMVVSRYAEGINAYINSLSDKKLPLEYKLLGYKPEPWTMLKSALLLRSMAQTLNMGDKDMQMTNALKLFGKEMVEVLYPDLEPMGDPIVEKPGKWNFEPVPLSDTIQALPDELIKISGLVTPAPTLGSNNWAVSGSKTKSGYPILCNDPHLTITLPSIWYAIQLQAPGINCMGVSLPGAPGVIIGFNDSIAWGVTNAQRDLVDWYRITFENNQKEKYKLDGGWKDTRKVIEKINIRGSDPFYDTVTYTHWGPVPFDENFRAENNRKHYAFRWIAHDESEELLTFYKLNRAKNHADYMRALDHYSSPAQNFVFASVTGDIAMRIQGKFPARKKYEGKFVLDGSRSSQGPQAYIPFAHNVMDKNPERGFVSSANQYPADATYPYYINAVSYEAYRNRRINNLLRQSNNITITDMMNLQLDTYSIKAEELLPVLMGYVDEAILTNEESEALRLLKNWDYSYKKEAEAPAYFENWWRTLYASIWDELRSDSLSLAYPTAWNTIHLIKTKPDFVFFDDQSTPEKETLTHLVRQAFKKSVTEVESWKKDKGTPPRWADYKDTYVEHLTRTEPFSYHVQHGGHGDAVNASSRRHGPSWRMIVSVEPNGPKAFATYPGGQSGNPGSAHYNSMLGRWADGNYFNLMFLKQNKQPAGFLFTTTLKPK